jgi:hypothetical protein
MNKNKPTIKEVIKAFLIMSGIGAWIMFGYYFVIQLSSKF